MTNPRTAEQILKDLHDSGLWRKQPEKAEPQEDQRAINVDKTDPLLPVESNSPRTVLPRTMAQQGIILREP